MAGDYAPGGFDIGKRHDGHIAQSLDAAVLTIGRAFCTSGAGRPAQTGIFAFDDARLSGDVIEAGD